MKKLTKVGFVCLLLSVFLTSDSVTAQKVILINGEPTEVILSGAEIQSIVSTQLKNYMEAYGQEVDDNFVKSLVRIETPIQKEIAQTAAIKAANKRKKSFADVTQTVMAMTYSPQEEK